MKTIINSNQSIKDKFYYSDALKMIAEYKSEHSNDDGFLASEYFDVEALNRILSNPKCKGVRIFNAIQMLDGKKQNRLILIGVDENGKAILDYKTTFSAVSAAGIGSSVVLESTPLENGTPCPPMCGATDGQ